MDEELLRFETADGRAVVVAVDEHEGGMERVGGPWGDLLAARTSLDDALEVIRTTADTVVGKVRDLARQPDEVTVEFGIQLSGRFGAIIASGQAQAHLTVTLRWEASE